MSRVLVYSASLTIGLLVALAMQAWLNREGFDLLALWQGAFSSQMVALRTAGPWWAMAGAAFVAAGAAASALSRMPPPWSRFRLLRWLLGAAILAILADIGHSAGGPSGDMGGRVAANLTALGIAALMALCGAYFTVKR
jgi:hypothetical protein